MTESRPKAVQKTIVIEQTRERVFEVWTQNIHQWWPSNHRLSKDPTSKVILEARAQGRFYERTHDGAEFEFGSVELCDPPAHLVLNWYLGSNQTMPSKVDIRFTALTEKTTRIDIEHTGAEQLGDLWWQRVTKFDGSWDVILSAFKAQLFPNDT